jgi:hypothetical protein
MNDTERLNWLEKQDGSAVINNDAGMWAFASDGFQNIEFESDAFDLESTWLVEKHAFKPTLRKAIDHAIKKGEIK